MSFDVFLQRFVGGEPAEANRDHVHAVLRSRQYSGPDRFGYYTVTFPDGVEVELSAEGLDGKAEFTGCSFQLRSMSPYLPEFILELAKAGDMVVLPATERSVAFLSSPEQKEHLPPDLARDGWELVVCNSATELESLLCGGLAAWQRYLGEILNKNPRV
jgi:hypothetical protein